MARKIPLQRRKEFAAAVRHIAQKGDIGKLLEAYSLAREEDKKTISNAIAAYLKGIKEKDAILMNNVLVGIFTNIDSENGGILRKKLVQMLGEMGSLHFLIKIADDFKISDEEKEALEDSIIKAIEVLKEKGYPFRSLGIPLPIRIFGKGRLSERVLAEAHAISESEEIPPNPEEYVSTYLEANKK